MINIDKDDDESVKFSTNGAMSEMIELTKIISGRTDKDNHWFKAEEVISRMQVKYEQDRLGYRFLEWRFSIGNLQMHHYSDSSLLRSVIFLNLAGPDK